MFKKIVLDVLKPLNPSILEFAEELLKIRGVNSVEITNIEIDREVENVKIILYGKLDYERIRRTIENFGATIHSIDGVVASRK